jgi:hypothetical protein
MILVAVVAAIPHLPTVARSTDSLGCSVDRPNATLSIGRSTDRGGGMKECPSCASGSPVVPKGVDDAQMSAGRLLFAVAGTGYTH